VRPHVDEDQWLRFEGLVALKTRADVDTFSDWVFSLNINQVTGMCYSTDITLLSLNAPSVVEPQTESQVDSSWTA
jgi:hypothetical protein